MPYKSEAQRKLFNSLEGKKKLGEEEVEHWNEVSKGMKLPEKAVDRAIKICDESYPAWGVSYTSGYAGGGVNRTDRKYFRSKEAAQKFAEELKRKNYSSVSISKFDNFYHTAKDAGKYGVHRITYKDVDGKKTTEIIKGSVEKAKNRVNELEGHDCKIIKQEMFIDWRQ
jgi:hypothetical protein